MRLPADELLNLIRCLIDKCRVVGGVFTFLCHNTTLRDESFTRTCGNILDMLTPSDRFDWQSSLSNEWV